MANHSRDAQFDATAALAQRFPLLASGDAARKTLAWFERKIVGEAEAIGRDWQDTRARMLEVNRRKRIIRLVSIENDFWISKRANPSPKPKNFIMPFAPDFEPWSLQQWWPPEDWRDWPLFDDSGWLGNLPSIRTKSLEPPNPEDAGSPVDRPRAMDIMADLLTGEPRTPEALLVTQAAAWLDTALGRIGRLGARHTARDIDPEVLLADIESHMLRPGLPVNAKSLMGDYVFVTDFSIPADMMEDALQKLFGSVVNSASTLDLSYASGGQSHEWKDYFQALGHVMPLEHTLMAVQLASCALRSESVWTVLQALRAAGRNGSGNPDLVDLSMCIRRRWMLALKALAWLEASLQCAKPFAFVTPADLACFAIDSLLPLYPRPVVAVSHRSADAKTALAASKAWGANEVMLDATFRPVWQTNRAMVWSLFAATPVLCKIRSANYGDSEWCRRESELFQHLASTADFLRGRRVLEIDLDSIALLEKAAITNPKTHRWFNVAAGVDSPPMELRRMETWQGVMITAASVARFTARAMALASHPGYPPSDLANHMLKMLYSPDEGAIPDGDFWVFERGWQKMSAVLRAGAAALALEGPLAKVVKDETAEDVTQWFEAIAKDPPNVQNTELNPCDLCAALEWRAHLEPYLRKHNAGTMLENQAAIIDLRDTNVEEWRSHPGWTVARGLISLRLPFPIIVRQRAGQNAEKWPLFTDIDVPIFTEHLPDQRLPQGEVFFSLGGSWPGLFAEALGEFIELEPSLAKACHETLLFGPDPVMMRADGGLSSLSVSEDHDFEEWLRNYGESDPDAQSAAGGEKRT
jgi:hypothetical protein